MALSKVIHVIQVVFLVGILVTAGLVTQSYAQDSGQKPTKTSGQMLSVPEIVDVLVSFAGSAWDSDLRGKGGGACQRFIMWREIILQRQGPEEIKALSAVRYYPEGNYYQTLKVTGPVLRYVSTVNVCDASANSAEGGCDSTVAWTIDVVSKTHVMLTMKVLRGGSGAGVATGQTCTVSFKKK